MPTIGFPLLLIPFAIYNIIVFLMHGVGFSTPILTVHLMSGADWNISLGDMLVALGIVLMLFEFARSSRPGSKYIMDHLLSLLVFGGGVAEFLLLPAFATSTFFLLVVLSGLDFLSSLMWAFRYRKWVRQDRKYAAEQAAKADATTPVTPVSPARKDPERTAPVFETVPQRLPEQPVDSRATMEVVTPGIDTPPETADAGAQTATPAAHVADRKPETPSSPSPATPELSVADIVSGSSDQSGAVKKASSEDTTHPPIVPSKD